MKPLNFPNKQIRAKVIANHVTQAKIKGVVCFSCGNASAALKEAGLYVVDISPRGKLSANEWWTESDIALAFPHLFDATSGHLSVGLMLQIGNAFKEYLGELPETVVVHAGSGETALSLSMAYPNTNFIALYDNTRPATTYSHEAPLNNLVARLCNVQFAPVPIIDSYEHTDYLYSIQTT